MKALHIQSKYGAIRIELSENTTTEKAGSKQKLKMHISPSMTAHELAVTLNTKRNKKLVEDYRNGIEQVEPIRPAKAPKQRVAINQPLHTSSEVAKLISEAPVDVTRLAIKAPVHASESSTLFFYVLEIGKKIKSFIKIKDSKEEQIYFNYSQFI